METPPSGMPSPPLSPHGTPSSLSSEFPSLEGSIYSVLAPDSPCSDNHRYTYGRGRGGGFTSHDVHHEAMQHLILPSLTLQQQQSRALSRTASVAGLADYGSTKQTAALGEPSRPALHHAAVISPVELPDNVRLLVIGRHGAGKTFLCENLVQGSVEGFGWSYLDSGIGKLLSQTTPVDDKRKNGLKLIRLDGWDESDEPSQVLDSILATIHHPFRELDQVLHPTAPASTASVNLSIDLLTSTAAPLYTAAIVVLSPHSTPIETTLLRSLSHHIPVIPFSPHQQRRRRHHSPDYYNDSRAQSRHRPSSRLSHSQYSRAGSRAPSVPRLAPISDSPNAFDQVPNFTFHPTSHRALKEWLFDESTVKTLRKEAAEKFLTWRERERKVEAYLTRPPRPTTDDSTPPHNSLMHQHQEQHQQPPVIPLDAFERFTFDQIFTPSDFESADLDSEVDRAVAGFATTDDEGEVADVESRGQSDAEDVGLARGQYLGREAWEADLSRMVALRKRERDQQHHRQQSSYTLSTIRPSSFHTQFQTDRSLRRPLSEVVPSHVEADNLLLFHPNPSAGTRRGAVAALESDATPDYDSLEHGEAGYQTASSDVGSCFSSAFPPTSTTADLNARPPNQDTAASDPPAPAIVDFASVDPLHFPSLLSLALSILPEIKTRIVARIKFWFLPAAFTLPRHSDDLGDVVNEKKHPHHQVGKRGEPLWDEKRGVDSESECGSEVENEQYSNEIMLSLPAVGAIAAAAAALGFWAGVSMEGRAGLLTLRSM